MTPYGEVRVFAGKSIESTDDPLQGKTTGYWRKSDVWVSAKDSYRCRVELANASGKNRIASDLRAREGDCP